MRAFIAVGLDKKTKKYLAGIIDSLKKQDIEARWVKPENLHITLKFFGELRYKEIEKVKNALASLNKKVSRETVNLKKIGVFPNWDQPWVIFVSTDNEIYLRNIYECLENSLAGVGVKKENQFKAHITLARVKSKKNIEKVKRHAERTNLSASLIVDSVSLYKSALTKNGPIYDELFKVSF
ncbi:MAG: RNA 2',3'-cyclic phosphodiesterase [Candidatus Omnitrophica bacterium]|nr:RNA 2',3'-cyclic phosphodiesterase [Candidatus Omnitrophota bacterium]